MSETGETLLIHEGSSLPSPIQRGWNRLWSRFRARKINFVYSTDYGVDLGTTPIDVQRSERILTFLLASGLLPPERLHRPESASLWDLRLAHAAPYLEELRQPEALYEIVGVEVWPELHQQALLAQRAAVGGTILAARSALSSQNLAVNLGGGFHHAGRHAGRGFCIFNDVAVAIHRCRRDGFASPILVVDLDLHDGNGTREIFSEDETVYTLSIHNQSWDQTPAIASRSIELGDDVDDTDYLTTVQEHTSELLHSVQPGLVFFLAGTDPASDDRLGNWNISAAGMLDRDQYVVTETRRQLGNLPMVILLAGGYGPDTWRYSARFLAWLLNRRGIEPPSTNQITLARYRYLSQELQKQSLSSPEGEDDWGFTDADIFGGLGSEARSTLFLGHYSHHALELSLEWTGIFDRLRQMGFTHPHLVLDLENPAGHTARVFADQQQQELLVELRLRIDRRSLPDCKLLSLEWLLLQNPRARFTEKRPALPGQSFPGLGLVPDIMSLLILVCDRLQMDGLTFFPSHFHLALKARPYLKFVKPADEGWFRATRAAVGSQPLIDATRLIAEGRLRNASNGEAVLWHPMQMVLPISDHLHDLVEGEAYEQEAERVAASLKLEIDA